MRLAARQDPAGFLDRLELPVLIDEVQYAPDLFPYIKMVVDKEQQNGPQRIWHVGKPENTCRSWRGLVYDYGVPCFYFFEPTLYE